MTATDASHLAVVMNLSRVQCSLVLSNEISNVATALRQTTRWENEYDEPLEDTLHGEFVSLQQKVLYMRQWEVVDPFEYVAPFLDVVRSEHVGADITSTALAALWKLLTANVVPASHHNSAQTLKHVVSALDGCKFTKASNVTYETVVTRLVQVFAACVCAEVGVLLNAEDVTLVTMSIWKWCEYSPTNESVMRTSHIFLQTVRQCLQQLISCLFSRLRTCQVFPDEIPVPTEYGEQTLDYVGLRSDAVYQPPGVSFHLTEESMVANHLCCGLEPFHEILIYCTEPMLIESDTEPHTDRILFVLQMLHTAIVHAGEILAGYGSLLTVIRGHVFPALTFCLHRMSQRIHAAVFQVVFAMYKLFGDELLLQIECFFQTSVLRLCEGRGCPTQEHQEIALEALVDFCGYPGFLRDIYLNLDCRIERSNLFEDICSLLSKTAFPVKTPLYSIHMISMEGLLAMLLTLSSACGGDEAPVDLPEPKSELPCYVDVWTELFRGVSPQFAEVEGLLDEIENEDMKHVMIISLEKRLKQRIAVAVDHFNRDFKKGFQYLRSIRLFPEENNADVIAKFLRVCPNLNGHIMGDMLGDCDPFYQEILECFTETFDFSGKTIDAALRMYFDVFKVPGEAQKVDRVLSKFSKVFYDYQDGTFKNEDSVHILAYSIIMLNTDLHKPEIKNKMTPDQFIRNNRGMNGEEDFPKRMLEDIYQSIKEQPMRISDGSHLDFSPVRWMNLNQVSKTSRGKKENPLRLTSALDRDMFTLIWGPAVAAISVILDQANELTTVQTTLTGLKLAAKIAFFHGVDEVIDSLVVSLFKSTQMLSPRTPKALVQFGMKEEAQLATEAAFFIANKLIFLIRYVG